MSDSATPSNWFRRNRLVLALSLAAVCLVAAVLAVGHLARRRAEARLQARLDAIRAQGHPVTLAELNAWYQEPPLTNNAALLILEGISAKVDPSRTSNWLGFNSTNCILYPGAPIPAEARAELASLIGSNQTTLRLLREAAQRSESRYPINLNAGINTLLPHLGEVKQCVQLLRAEALHHALEQRPAECVEALMAGLQTARSLKDEPLLISFLVHTACHRHNVSALESVLEHVTFTPAQLKQLQQAYGELETQVQLKRVLAGERCSGISIFQLPGKDVVQMLGAMGAGMSPAANWGIALYDAAGLRQRDFELYLDTLDRHLQVVDLPSLDRVAAAKAIDLDYNRKTTDRPWEHVLGRIMLSGLAHPHRRHFEYVAYARLASTALAVERHRQDRGGTLPTDLAQLVPAYLPAVPLDPFTGKPLRYQASDPGYLLYCVGLDGVDQGGKRRGINSSEQDFDEVFSVQPAR